MEAFICFSFQVEALKKKSSRQHWDHLEHMSSICKISPLNWILKVLLQFNFKEKSEVAAGKLLQGGRGRARLRFQCGIPFPLNSLSKPSPKHYCVGPVKSNGVSEVLFNKNIETILQTRVVVKRTPSTSCF